MSISAQGIISDEPSIFTTDITDYEILINEDLDNDGAIGLNLNALTDVTYDDSGYQLKYDGDGSIYIWDGSDINTIISVVNDAGSSPIYEYSASGITSNLYAVYKDSQDQNDIHFKVAVKESTTTDDGTDVNWQILKVSELGLIDSQSTLEISSITTFEDEFGQDMNDDGDFSGTVTITNRDSDDVGVLLGEESGGGSLYIVDGETNIQINDSNIEGSLSWTGGSSDTVAVALSDLNNNQTPTDINDDFYQLAVKRTGSYTPYGGNVETYEEWLIYSLDTSGNVDHQETIKTNSIQNFEDIFGEDLDGDNFTGLNLSLIHI